MSKILECIHPMAFLLALSVGFLYVYMTAPQPTVIVRYPTPHNADTEIYRDKAGQCYKYQTEIVGCPTDPTGIQKVRVIA